MLTAANLTGWEYAALVFQLPFALGEEADPLLLPRQDHDRVLRACLDLCAAYTATYQVKEFSESDLDTMENRWRVCLTSMQLAFPKLKGCNFHRPKVHALSHLRRVKGDALQVFKS
jgi:hypothetical protein